ncbi:hypothetical protein Leryth_011042 [Lithospermum erythrorhizon]|nr:hypothetical protein Leryth_011042 [Lithospermum erythrorhizon]
MIQLGGYSPQLSLHNSLFKALVSQPAGTSKRYLKQAEFIYHNLTTTGLKIHDHIFGGLIWLHSYQDVIDKERIASLRVEMRSRGINEDKEVLLSVLRACSKEGDLEEAGKTWNKLLKLDNTLSSQAFVYIMELYAKIGHPMKSLDVFREMQEKLGSTSVAAYHKIIEVLCKAQMVEVAESVMSEFINSGLKPLMPPFIDLMDMYTNLSLHDKLEVSFFQCLQMCRPNHDIFYMYLNSLVQIGNLDKAEEIFNHMNGEGGVGVNTKLCNLLLRAYLFMKEYEKAKTLYDIMCKKKYGIESESMEKLEYVLRPSGEVIKNPTSLKLNKEQRDMLVGMLLGGLRIESDEDRQNHAIHFKFNDNSEVHTIFKRHVYDQYHEWIAFSDELETGDNEKSYHFSTIYHTYFSFYANQFFPNRQPVVPKLIHRWLSHRVLAYWYMYGGYRTSSGDIILKVKGSKDGVERIVKALKAKSLDCQVKHKGRVFWIGFLGNNAIFLWKLVEPFILDELKDLLEAGGDRSFDNSLRTETMDFNRISDIEGRASDFSEDDSS